MSYSPRVSVIILNWNGKSYLKECLDSVLKSNYNNYEVIVVDNASNDGSKETVKIKYPQVILIQNDRNLGFCRGNNIGINNSTGDIVILLNNDTIVHKDWIIEILNASRPPKVGVVGCRLFYAGTNIIQSYGFRMVFMGGWESIGAGQIDYGQFDDVMDVSYVSGAAIAIKRTVFSKIGLLDPNFHSYHEDADICFRAKKAGYSVVTSKAIVYHHGSLSWNHFPLKKIYLIQRNHVFFVLKHFSSRNLLYYILGFPIQSLQYCLCRFLKGETVVQRTREQKKGGKQNPFFPIRSVLFDNAFFLLAIGKTIFSDTDQIRSSKELPRFSCTIEKINPIEI